MSDYKTRLDEMVKRHENCEEDGVYLSEIPDLIKSAHLLSKLLPLLDLIVEAQVEGHEVVWVDAQPVTEISKLLEGV